MLLADLFRLFLSLFDGEEALRGAEERNFWNPIIKKSAEEKDRRVRHSSVV